MLAINHAYKNNYLKKQKLLQISFTNINKFKIQIDFMPKVVLCLMLGLKATRCFARYWYDDDCPSTLR